MTIMSEILFKHILMMTKMTIITETLLKRTYTTYVIIMTSMTIMTDTQQTTHYNNDNNDRNTFLENEFKGQR